MSGKSHRRSLAARLGLGVLLVTWAVGAVVWMVAANESTGTILGSGSRPAVATDTVGNQMVVWETPDGGVDAQAIDRFGSVVGVRLRIPAASDLQSRPDVAALPSGDFVVAWQDDDGSSAAISGVLVNGFGSVVGVRFQLADSGRDPVLGIDDQGGMVLVWTDLERPSTARGDLPDQARRYGRFAQRFSGFGSVVGVRLRLGERGPATPSALAVQPDGSFLVAWEDGTSDISAQAFDSDGNPESDVFRVNESRRGRQSSPAVTAAIDGSYTVVWENSVLGGQQRTVVGRKVSGFGSVVGVRFLVSETPFSEASEPSIATDSQGHLFVTWNCAHDSAESNRILGRIVDLDDGAVGTELQVGAIPFANAPEADTGNALNDFVVVWQGQSPEATESPAGSCVYVRQVSTPWAPDSE